MEKSEQRPLDFSLVWSGEGDNSNAALTLFRHFDSASIEFGFIGDQPKTAWLITYPLLERIHYLLVAGFDVYGNAGHQLASRMYMDFLRMDGEANFLEVLPLAQRRDSHRNWYRNTPDRVADYVFGKDFVSTQDSKIQYTAGNTQSQLFELLDQHTNGARQNRFSYDSTAPSIRQPLRRLASFRDASVSVLAQQFLLMVKNTDSSSDTYTVINNTAHSNINHVFAEEKERLPAEDTITVAKGFIGTYPNTFFAVETNKLDDFVDAVLALAIEEDYFELKSRYAIRRTSPHFWAFSDQVHALYSSSSPIEAGLLDYNRLENR